MFGPDAWRWATALAGGTVIGDPSPARRGRAPASLPTLGAGSSAKRRTGPAGARDGGLVRRGGRRGGPAARLQGHRGSGPLDRARRVAAVAAVRETVRCRHCGRGSALGQRPRGRADRRRRRSPARPCGSVAGRDPRPLELGAAAAMPWSLAMATAAGGGSDAHASATTSAVPWPEARRCTGRPASGACDVRLGTGRAWATTIPAGARGARLVAQRRARSAAAACGRGRRPGTASRAPRSAAARPCAGSAAGCARRPWIGSAHRRPGGAAARRRLRRAGAETPRTPRRPDALRPNGHGRRTGLTPPRTGAD